MAYGSGSVDSATVANTAADIPCFLATNIWAQSLAVAHQWRTGGSWASGSDDTDADSWEYYARDYLIHKLSRGTTAASTHYLLGEANPSANQIDVVAIGPSGNPPSVITSLDFEIADDNAYTTSLLSVGSFSSFADDSRCAQFNSTYYDQISYMRLKRVLTGALINSVSEVYAGPRYQPARASAQPYDPDGQYSSVHRVETASGHVYNHAYAKGQARRSIRLEFGTSADYSSFATFWANCNNGTRPFVYWDNPGTAPNRWMLMRFEDPDYKAQELSYLHRTIEFTMIECPPFLSQA